ncbi:CHST1 [Branchiostoma lanceolatum]|uniref:Sulfotransferase n=2 Tax=Branchiostoma lanceolatum TaxID=7740 RepID=A0A8J9YTB2_BRALA|nr:CHST1 [Branchiostoma lanceolatum]
MPVLSSRPVPEARLGIRMSVRGAVGVALLVMTLFCLCMLLFLGHLELSRPRVAMLNRALAGVQHSQRGTQRTFPVQQTVSREAVLPDLHTVSPRRTVSPNETMASFHDGMETMARSVEYVEEPINKEEQLSALRERWEYYPGNDYGEEGGQFGNQSGLGGDPARRLAVVVFAQMRTGSSFTGQLFNQHPSFFYMFEPLWHLHHPQNVAYRPIPVVNGRATVRLSAIAHRPPEATFGKVLEGILRCDFGELTKFIGRKGLFAAGSDRALVRFCDEVLHWPPRRCSYALRPQTLPKVVNYCKRTPYTAVKTIRIQNMNSLEHLLSDPTLDLKIVHLVRDPRATITSRLSLMDARHRAKLPFPPNLLNEKDINKLCGWITRSTVTTDVPSPWRDRYIMVRYEDLAEHPELMTKRLYEFLGVPLDDMVLHWVRENTKGDGKPHDHFSTKHHDANATAKIWRYRLSFPAVAKVQDMCRDAMKMVGYKEVDSPEKLRDLQTSLVDAIPANVIAIRP